MQVKEVRREAREAMQLYTLTQGRGREVGKVTYLGTEKKMEMYIIHLSMEKKREGGRGT